ncbi:IQ domain-containing protein IQM2-like [Tripterygium wilfordii]|uniref:IQ domain-containing protein IQM2-like n=1 Tax=Tripterygium wilfordii TaxID=458696 RepID=UPI0018F8323C|nr:IQ domain-containing protein IQM2-like [Tripterygium wilfordii]
MDHHVQTKRLPKRSMEHPSNREHEAARRLQKVYRSYRTIRKLADCAVLVGPTWWQPPKLGKGLSKSYKARHMVLVSLHWLEVIDPRHRYGHNLDLYYNKWLQCEIKEPFFSWLDVGEGKKLNLDECQRLKLQRECINYLGPMERKAYEVIIEDGKFLYKQTREFLHTTSDHAKWIYVLSPSKILYAGKKRKGTFQHSSFLAGGATIAAGRLVVEDGILKEVSRQSGHYHPREENLKDFSSFLIENNVDLTYVQITSINEEK